MNPAAERADAPEEGDGAIHHHEQHPGFVVIEQKNGREVTVGGPYDEATARSVLRLLAWAGAVARIERASLRLAPLAPGATFHKRKGRT